MQIEFCLGWIPSGIIREKSFKSKAAFDLFQDYVTRISHFSGCAVKPALKNPKEGILWICHTSPESKLLRSADLSKKIFTLQNSSCKKLQIAIGDSDGFAAETIRKLSPDLQWCFGPLTLPHELAAVVAAEQIYRAWTILHGLPYHSGH